MAGCYDCGLKYGGEGWIEAIIPDKVWNRIKPEGCADGCGLLCITCIVKRLRKQGFGNVPVPIWLCGTEPLEAQEGSPSKDIELLREWDVLPSQEEYSQWAKEFEGLEELRPNAN